MWEASSEERVLIGFITASAIAIAAFGPLPYWSEYGGPPWPSEFEMVILLISPIIAGFVSGFITGGGAKGQILSSVLPAIPATVVYACVKGYVGGDGMIAPVIGLLVAGLGAAGGAFSYLFYWMREVV